MKKIVAEAEFTAEQLNKISALARETALCEETVRILYGRGVDTSDKIRAFLHPSKDRYLNPYLMKGMKEAVELIKLARDEEWSVAIYGDYDADGVCASTIMSRVLAEFGIEAYVFVPERKNGYGLAVETIDNIFEECFPQLFITVDCGISNAAEVEYIKEQGAEVIITDHHELPETLPDCICINPKLEDDYPYDNLCGAGVAFKVGCALLGKAAYKYVDFAAIATIADSVPLVGENRDIVHEGLAMINSSPRPNYAGFLSKSGEKISAQGVAFSIAPKINAAGRMGDAGAALRLFLSDDASEIYDYSVKLTEYNAERQKYCEELYQSAKQKIKQKGADGRVILLWDEDWNSGFVGIVAARLAEEYCKPTLLFVKNGDLLKGSVRSIDGVNIFEALKACSHLISEFGGHSQAAGVNLEQDNLEELEKSLNEYLQKNYTAQSFTPAHYINGRIDRPLSQKFISELNLLEPYGVGNRKPQFAYTVTNCCARPAKIGSPHLTIKCGGQDFMYFSGKKHQFIINSAISKTLICEFTTTVFRGKEQSKAYVRDVIYGAEQLSSLEEECALNAVSVLASGEVECNAGRITHAQAQSEIDGCGEYGTVFVAFNPKTLARYDLKGKEVNAFSLSAAALSSVVILSPQLGCDLSGYENIVFLDDIRAVTLPSLEGKSVKICAEDDGIGGLAQLNTDRNQLGYAYKVISANGNNLFGSDAEEIAVFNPVCTTSVQTLFSIKVFEELGLVRFTEGRLTVDRSKKTQLTNSKLYNFVAAFTGEV